MSANVEAMVREGVNAFKSGRKDEAHALLLKATELDPYNEQAWLWLSGLMEGAADQRTCLENVLAINPNNERAKQGLAYLTGQTSYGNVSPFSAASAPPSSAPPSTSPPGIAPSAPTSVEWGMPDPTPTTPPAWTPPPPAEPSSDVLDDWVSNLNLPATDNHSTPGAFTADATSSPFGGSPFGDFDVDDDMFAGGPFSAPAATADSPSPAPRRRSGSSRRTSPPPPPPQRRESRETTSSFEDERDETYLEENEEGLFGYIPPEIAPTRLPGTRERTPILLTLALIVLILLNIGVGSLVMFAILA